MASKVSGESGVISWPDKKQKVCTKRKKKEKYKGIVWNGRRQKQKKKKKEHKKGKNK